MINNDILVGNSVRFRAQFYDFDNVVIDATEVVFTVYNSESPPKKVQETPLTAGNKTGVGAYWCVFTPASVGNFQIEFTGLINGVPALTRQSIKVKQI